MADSLCLTGVVGLGDAQERRERMRVNGDKGHEEMVVRGRMRQVTG